jgi:hypothetical protein
MNLTRRAAALSFSSVALGHAQPSKAVTLIEVE